MKTQVTLSVLAAAATFAIAVAAQTTPMTNFQIATRKGAMNLQSKYAGPLFAMARGARPYDAQIVQRNADYLLVISQMPWDDFQPNSLGLSNTKAKDAIVKDADKFKKLVDTLQSEEQKLAAAARNGDQAAVKSAVQAMGRTCNSCHEDFSDFDFRFKFE
jgi:cytochrome c556